MKNKIEIMQSAKYVECINNARKYSKETLEKIAKLAELSKKSIHLFVKDAVFNCILQDISFDDYIESEYNKLK